MSLSDKHLISLGRRATKQIYEQGKTYTKTQVRKLLMTFRTQRSVGPFWSIAFTTVLTNSISYISILLHMSSHLDPVPQASSCARKPAVFMLLLCLQSAGLGAEQPKKNNSFQEGLSVSKKAVGLECKNIHNGTQGFSFPKKKG